MTTTHPIAELARRLDHTNLKPQATAADIQQLATEARDTGCAAACVLPYWVKDTAQILAGSPTATCTVVGFPLGGNTTKTKLLETDDALIAGATEVDMVINIGAALSASWDLVFAEITAFVGLCHQGDAIAKIILETCFLQPESIAHICRAASGCGADFVKTSTGFGPAGATLAAVTIMAAAIGPGTQIKASGGIRNLAACQDFIAAGASRIGTSASLAILAECR